MTAPNDTHVETPECGFDRNASLSAHCYVCACGWSNAGAAIQPQSGKEQRSVAVDAIENLRRFIRTSLSEGDTPEEVNRLLCTLHDDLDNLRKQIEKEIAFAASATPASGLGEIFIKYFDRLNDAVPSDPMRNIVAELLAEANAYIRSVDRSKG